MSRGRVPFWKSLGRSQVSSFVASAIDLGVYFSATEFLGLWYVLSAGLGALCGALTNFRLNRYWSFEAEGANWKPQALRYALVSSGSLGLNMLGVYVFTDLLGIQYGISKVLTSLGVGLLFNFPLHRRYVFK